jgi:hypothetical protein
MITPSETFVRSIDLTAASYEFAPGRWNVWGDDNQPLGFHAGHTRDLL